MILVLNGIPLYQTSAKSFIRKNNNGIQDKVAMVQKSGFTHVLIFLTIVLLF